ncbi:hypothetical protein HanHA300_Chr02g0066081 [Helianthus annuus]|nr:hypothetical protein HanHA300_Chr02g0066081 [Helianthus annuus]
MKKLLFSGVVWILCSYFTFSQPPKLHKQEVEVLLKIWEKLGVVGKKEWSLNKDPCSSAEVEWGIVECNCSFESNTTCRITTMISPSMLKLQQHPAFIKLWSTYRLPLDTCGSSRFLLLPCSSHRTEQHE